MDTLPDSVLEGRLQVLEESLKRAQEPSTWKTQLELRNVRVEEMVWNGAIMQIRRAVGDQLEAVRSIRETCKEPEHLTSAWKQYSNVHEVSQQVFRECLELIGGLALRDKLLDDQICELTDELISGCAEAMISFRPFTVPAPEAFSKTLARIVRMRFPEWTIWTLPLAAHEYGHVAMEETAPALLALCRTEAESLTGLEASTLAPEDDAGRETLARAEHHLRVLLADAFGTFTLGPAYACAAVLLRFDPLATAQPGAPSPSDGTRANMVLGVLEAMSAQTNNAYKRVTVPLRKAWEGTVAATTPAGAPAPEFTLSPAKVLEQFGKELDIRGAVRYPRGEHGTVSATGGWAVAEGWAETWQKQLHENQDLTLPQVSRASKLRDALNASWLWRLESDSSPEVVRIMEKKVRELCNAIIAERLAPEKRPRRPSPASAAVRARGG